jgi:hypothetical protein
MATIMETVTLSKMENPIEIQTYRYLFSTELSIELNEFARIHRYDDRKTFKNEWVFWIAKEDIKNVLQDEIKRLHNLGCEDDILDKMFKSARYYYRKKPEIKEVIKTERKKYTGFTKAILESMDTHIRNEIQKNIKKKGKSENIVNISDISPADAYDNYVLENQDIIIREIKIYKGVNQTIDIDIEELSNKIKKTYKNRFYVFTRKNREQQ